MTLVSSRKLIIKKPRISKLDTAAYIEIARNLIKATQKERLENHHRIPLEWSELSMLLFNNEFMFNPC